MEDLIIPGWAVSIIGGLIPLAFGWMIILNRQITANEKETAILMTNFKNLSDIMQDTKQSSEEFFVRLEGKFDKLNGRFEDLQQKELDYFKQRHKDG
jgi:hypothetical protein